jgi:hypothetical protein
MRLGGDRAEFNLGRCAEATHATTAENAVTADHATSADTVVGDPFLRKDGSTQLASQWDVGGQTIWNVNVLSCVAVAPTERYSGDLSNPVLSARASFQTSTLPGDTIVQVLPNGAATVGAVSVFGKDDADNAPFATFACDGDAGTAHIDCGASGTGSVPSFSVNMDGAPVVTVSTAGDVGVVGSVGVIGSIELGIAGDGAPGVLTGSDGSGDSSLSLTADSGALGKNAAVNITANAYGANDAVVLTTVSTVPNMGPIKILNVYTTSIGVGIGVQTPTAKLQVLGLEEHADNAAALFAGLTAGAFYRTGDVLKVVH